MGKDIGSLFIGSGIALEAGLEDAPTIVTGTIFASDNAEEDTDNEGLPTDTKKKKKSGKNGRIKTTKLKLKKLGEGVSENRFSILEPSILNTTRALVLRIEEKEKVGSGLGFFNEGVSNNIEKELSGSWVELFLFLLGSVYTANEADFTKKISSAGVFNSNVVLRRKVPIYLDTELERGLNLYNIPFTDLKVEVHDPISNIHSSIKALLNELEINPKSVYITMENIGNTVIESSIPNIFDGLLAVGSADTSAPPSVSPTKSKRTTKKSANTSSTGVGTISIPESTDNPIHLWENASVHLCRKEVTLYSLVTKGIPDTFNVDTIQIEDAESSTTSVTAGVIFLVSYLVITGGPSVTSALASCTVKDSVGVTLDNQDYRGVMDLVKIPNSDFYFYTNGSIRMLLKYLYNLCDKLSIDPDTIKFRYTTLEL